MKNPFHNALLCMSPERAHDVAMGLLKAGRMGLPLIRSRPSASSIQIPGFERMRFRNRIGMAAGFDKNAEVFPWLDRFGFGFVEVGTVTPMAQGGNPKPRLWRTPSQGLVNRMGFNNVGLEQFCANIDRYRRLSPGLLLWANVGKGRETPNELAVNDYATCANRLKDRVDGLVVNVSSPNTPELRKLQTGSFLEELAAVLPAEIPTLVKFAPDLANEELARLCEQVGENQRFAGVVVTNTSRELAQSRGFDAGGYSGPQLFERAVECVTIARENLRTPKIVVGVGGISSREQAQSMRQAGADLIELYTAFIYQGPQFVSSLDRALRD